MSNWHFYQQHFGSVRLRHYLTFCAGDRERAMALYRWNVEVSGAFWESLAYFEVAFRHAIDDRMRGRQVRFGRPRNWLFDDARELGRDANGAGRHRRPYAEVDEAIRRVRRNGKKIDPGQIISELSFGFWHQMVSRRRMALWPDLASAFPHAPNRRQRTVNDPIGRLREFRNRIGHHHRIWSEDVAGRYGDLLDVAGFIDPALQVFIGGRSRIPAILNNRP